MTTHPKAPAPPIDWIRAKEAMRRLGIGGRELFMAELASGRLGIRARRFGKRGLLMVAEQDIDRAAQRLAQGEAA